MSKLIEMKTANLIGPALDWAVTEAAGGVRKPFRVIKFPRGTPQWIMGEFRPSTDWSLGGPLIQRYGVDIEHLGDGRVLARIVENGAVELGPDELIAACRAIVAMQLGDTVQVPAELAEGGDA